MVPPQITRPKPPNSGKTEKGYALNAALPENKNL